MQSTDHSAANRASTGSSSAPSRKAGCGRHFTWVKSNASKIPKFLSTGYHFGLAVAVFVMLGLNLRAPSINTPRSSNQPNFQWPGEICRTQAPAIPETCSCCYVDNNGNLTDSQGGSRSITIVCRQSVAANDTFLLTSSTCRVDFLLNQQCYEHDLKHEGGGHESECMNRTECWTPQLAGFAFWVLLQVATLWPSNDSIVKPFRGLVLQVVMLAVTIFIVVHNRLAHVQEDFLSGKPCREKASDSQAVDTYVTAMAIFSFSALAMSILSLIWFCVRVRYSFVEVTDSEPTAEKQADVTISSRQSATSHPSSESTIELTDQTKAQTETDGLDGKPVHSTIYRYPYELPPGSKPSKIYLQVRLCGKTLKI